MNKSAATRAGSQLEQLSPEARALLLRRLRKTSAQKNAKSSPDSPVPTGLSRGPLSFTQERFWLAHQMDPKSATYNLPMAVRIDGELDAAALRGSVRELIRRHQTLRTRFLQQPDGLSPGVVNPPPAASKSAALRSFNHHAHGPTLPEPFRPAMSTAVCLAA